MSKIVNIDDQGVVNSLLRWFCVQNASIVESSPVLWNRRFVHQRAESLLFFDRIINLLSSFFNLSIYRQAINLVLVFSFCYKIFKNLLRTFMLQFFCLRQACSDKAQCSSCWMLFLCNNQCVRSNIFALGQRMGVI